jgi:hypothetical protein
VRQSTTVPLAPEAAAALWEDTSRWSAFVDGFGRVVERSRDWPEPNARVVWDSGPAGRGRVTETVLERAPGVRFVTDVSEEQLAGRQTVSFGEDERGALVELELDYELARGGPLRRLVDALFIRRALAESLARTLRRFAAEAAEQSSL